MANTMQFDLVSPERSLASLAVTAVQLPGADGDMTAMSDHTPTLTTLRPGLLKVEAPGGSSEYLVTGGFAQINGDSMSVLAEKAIPVAEVTRSHLDDLVAEARASHETAKADDDQTNVDDAAKLLADMEALGTHMSL